MSSEKNPEPKTSFLHSLVTAFKKHIPFFIIGGILLVAFYAFSFLVKENFFTRFDFDMTVRIQNAIPRRLDPFLSLFSILGSFEVTLGILLIITAVSFFKKKYLALLLIPAFGFMHIVEIIGKRFLDHPATPFMFHRYALDVIFPSSYVQPGGSYPSGHAMRTAYLTVLFFYLIWRTKKINTPIKIFLSCVLLGFYGVMMVSRVSLGEHWTTDVIGGSLLGAAFAMFSLILI